MPSRSFGEFHLHYEAPEAGRYRAPILVLPGLFQSFECWRLVTSMLAHRGWEVYALTRTMPDREGDPRLLDRTWEEARRRVLEVAPRLDERVVLLGADLGAALALSVAEELNPLALALFAPAAPSHLAASRRKATPRRWSERLGLSRPPAAEAVAAPAAWMAGVPAAHTSEEPNALLEELERLPAPPTAPRVPTVVFAPSGDPLVSAQHALGFAAGPQVRASNTALPGRFWPRTSAAVADEVHRFLILTLADRVVEFPDEILADDED